MARRYSLIIGLFALLTLAASPAEAQIAFDTAFGDSGFVISDTGTYEQRFYPENAVALRDGGIAILSWARGKSGVRGIRVYTKNGQLDQRFGRSGIARLPGQFRRRASLGAETALRVSRDGAIYVVAGGNVGSTADRKKCHCSGNRGGILAARLRADGEIDRSYGRGGFTALSGTSPLVVGASSSSHPDLADAAIDRRGGLVVYANTNQLKVTRADRNDPAAVILRADASGKQDFEFGGGGRITERTGQRRAAASMNIRSSDGAIVTARDSNSSHENLDLDRIVTQYSFVRRYDASGRPLRGSGASRAYSRFTVREQSKSMYLITSHVDARGRVLIEPQPNWYNVRVHYLRFAADGSRDRKFGKNGRLTIDLRDVREINYFTPEIVLNSRRDLRAVTINTTAVRNGHWVTSNWLIEIDGRGRIVPGDDGEARQLIQPHPTLQDYSYLMFDAGGGRIYAAGSSKSFDTRVIGDESFYLARYIAPWARR